MAPGTSTARKNAPPKGKKKPSELEILIAKHKETEKLLAKAQADLLVKRNNELLDEEEEEEEERPKKKSKKNSTTSSESGAVDVFGKADASSMVGLLGAPRVEVDDPTSDDEPAPPDGPSDDEPDVADDDIEDENKSPVSGVDPDMVISSPAANTKKTPRAVRHTGSKSSSSTRVTQSTFSPVTQRIANMGRHELRVGIATTAAFPADHGDFAWKSTKKAVAASESRPLAERLAETETSPERHADLVHYVWGGASQIRSEVKTHAKSAVALFGIPGDFSQTEIVDLIAWLTCKKGIFKYGGIDLKNRTYNIQQPYGAAFYMNVIMKQWFETMKSEGVRVSSMNNFINIPAPLLALVTDAMDNSLKEWATGVRVGIKFTQEEYGPKYDCHLAAVLNIQSKSPSWFADFQQKLYKKIITTSNFAHLKLLLSQATAADDELDGIDFAALEASVSTTPTPAAVTVPVVAAATVAP
ncbi:hypothetical protein C8J57DRAFT_1518111 [Mycena rebaudengoi]|nr:hypothetical protein C8J57DRAFT_1518111 [Mycena rebaudengoi]